MFSVSLLYSAHDFLKLIPESGMTPSYFKSHFNTFKYSTAEKILDVSFKCGWSKLTKDGIIVLSERGKHVSTVDYKSALLFQLEDLILNFNPVWGSILLKGRSDAKNFLPLDVAQCFKESGLFDELNEEIIKFWDKLALAYRNYSQKRMTEIGRTGEKLSYEYEWRRTGHKPIWQAVESNLAGFDILSVADATSQTSLQIEVKATTSEINYAKIHITRNEWDTAINSRNFIFHLWQIEKEQLFEVSVLDVAKHIPTDNGDGEWESVEIPFKVLIQ
ncbi:MAG: DUF3883 domain-containing protein [Ferruginibacter sp.]